MAYYYLDETADFEYTVRVSPGPVADDATAIVHKQRPDGAVASRLPLQKKGSADFSLVLSSFQLEDSPLFIEFVFTKGDRKFRSLHGVSLARAVPATCTAELTAGDASETVQLQVTGWNALAYDRPGTPTEYMETKPERVSRHQRSQVKWQVDGQDIAETGESTSFKLADGQRGRILPVEAYAEDTPPGRATAQVDCRLELFLQLISVGDKVHRNERVQVVEADSGDPVGDPVVADDDGVVRVFVPKDGDYSVRIIDEDPVDMTMDGVLGGPPILVPILSCRFFDQADQPVANEKVTVKSDNESFEQTTDADGRFECAADAAVYELTIKDQTFKASPVLLDEKDVYGDPYCFFVSGSSSSSAPTDGAPADTTASDPASGEGGGDGQG